ncbi:unnamed protein product [Heligmosomoides polygyrus]|uniref:Uncharacterized protein n=1 Tax=Heligmosomoides polygyrus TaxID=6339 RepID=A0A183GJ88_HELPZ|nr:unnamed protein product [Heligmosomoides polygyrus]
MVVATLRAAGGGRRGFREFDEDDLESYLEGSLLSERLGGEKIQNQIVTIFPCISSNSSVNAPTPPTLETVFTTTLETIFM